MSKVIRLAVAYAACLAVVFGLMEIVAIGMGI